jgi:hypothetical protein
MNYDPRDADLLAWLKSLSSRQQYVSRCALLKLFESFRASDQFKRETETLREQLALDEKGLARLRKQADARAREIRRQLEKSARK